MFAVSLSNNKIFYWRNFYGDRQRPPHFQKVLQLIGTVRRSQLNNFHFRLSSFPPPKKKKKKKNKSKHQKSDQTSQDRSTQDVVSFSRLRDQKRELERCQTVVATAHVHGTPTFTSCGFAHGLEKAEKLKLCRKSVSREMACRAIFLRLPDSVSPRR